METKKWEALSFDKWCFPLFYCEEFACLVRPDPKQDHGDDYEEEVQRLALDVLLMEEQPAGDEAHDDTRATDQRDNRDQCVGIGEGVEIAEVGNREEYRNKHNLPAPFERMLRAMLLGPPE